MAEFKMVVYTSYTVLFFLLVQTATKTNATTSNEPPTTIPRRTKQQFITTTLALNGTCTPECKYGDCQNGKCECIQIFQGDDCRQPKPWFLVVACVAGTLVLMVLCCCVCYLCSCGKKKNTIQPED